MHKTTTKEFEDFKTEFTKWQRKLGLTNYEIFFSLTQLNDGVGAAINTDQPGKAATVMLTKKIPGDRMIGWDVRKSARHEAFHLLISRINHIGSCRCIDDTELDEEDESIVRRLEAVFDADKLIKG